MVLCTFVVSHRSRIIDFKSRICKQLDGTVAPFSERMEWSSFGFVLLQKYMLLLLIVECNRMPDLTFSVITNPMENITRPSLQ